MVDKDRSEVFAWSQNDVRRISAMIEGDIQLHWRLSANLLRSMGKIDCQTGGRQLDHSQLQFLVKPEENAIVLDPVEIVLFLQ